MKSEYTYFIHKKLNLYGTHSLNIIKDWDEAAGILLGDSIKISCEQVLLNTS